MEFCFCVIPSLSFTHTLRYGARAGAHTHTHFAYIYIYTYITDILYISIILQGLPSLNNEAHRKSFV